MSTFTMATLESVRGEIFHSKYYLNIRSGYMAPVTLHCSYGDSGETVSFYIFDGTEKLDLTSAVASVHGTRIDGADFGPFACTISDGNKVSFTLDSAMTAVEGSAIAEIVITSGGATIGTCNFGILIENAVFPNGVAYDNDPAVYQNILKYVQTMAANTKSELRTEYLGKISSEASARQSADNTINNTISTLSQRVETAISGASEDDELTDIRVGYESGGETTTTYTTAGTSVRAQVKDLWDRINMQDIVTATYKPIILGTGGNMTANNRAHFRYYSGSTANMRDGLIPVYAGDIIEFTPSTTSFSTTFAVWLGKNDVYGSTPNIDTGWFVPATTRTYAVPFDGFAQIVSKPCYSNTNAGDTSTGYSALSEAGTITIKSNLGRILSRGSWTVSELSGGALGAGGSMTTNNRINFLNQTFNKGDILIKADDRLQWYGTEYQVVSGTTQTYVNSSWTFNSLIRIAAASGQISIGLRIGNNDSSSFSSADEGKHVIYHLSKVGSTGGGSIVGRNADILPAVYASSYYGHNGTGTANKNKQFSMVVVTDIHADSARFANAIEYIDSTASIDAGICLGDIQAANFSTDKAWYVNAVNGCSKPFYTVIGNHDGGNSATRSISGTKEEVVEAFIQSTKNKIGISDISTGYYAKTWSDYKVVVIVLDNYDLPDTLDGSGNFVYSRGLGAFSQAQITWLLNTLAAVPADHSVIICSHYVFDAVTDVDCIWDNKDHTTSSSETNAFDYPNIIPDIVNAWKNRTNISKSYAPITNTGLPTLTASKNFTSLSGTGKFAGYFFGHLHSDEYGYITKYSDQLCYGFDTSANDLWQNNWSDLPRINSTKMEDCITVVTIDNSTDTVRLVRVGSNITTDMRNRTMFISQFDQAVTS